MRDYYLVVNEIVFNRKTYPEFLNCAFIKNSFVVIDNLELYLSNGDGLSDRVLNKTDGYIKIVNGKYKESLSFLSR